MKRKVKYQDRDIEGTEVVLRLEGEYNNLGDPIYIVHTQNIVTASNVPEHMRKQQC